MADMRQAFRRTASDAKGYALGDADELGSCQLAEDGPAAVSGADRLMMLGQGSRRQAGGPCLPPVYHRVRRAQGGSALALPVPDGRCPPPALRPQPSLAWSEQHGQLGALRIGSRRV